MVVYLRACMYASRNFQWALMSSTPHACKQLHRCSLACFRSSRRLGTMHAEFRSMSMPLDSVELERTS